MTPFSSKPSSIPLESLSDSETKDLANCLLDNTFIAGPIYHSINKRLACIYFKENQNQLAIFHLAESHGCSLRHQAVYRYERMQSSEKAEEELGRNLLEIVELDSQYTEDKEKGLYNRLAELPSEWTIVQLTVQYDPMLRITQNPTRKHNPIHFTRMSCGDIVTKMNSHKQGGPPLSVLLSPSSDSDILDIVTTITDTLESHRLARSSKVAINNSQQFSSKLMGLIADFETLLGDTKCILPGNLVDTKLHKMICTKVDKIVKEIAGSTEITESQMQAFYLLATYPAKLYNKESILLKAVLPSCRLGEKLYKAIVELHEQHLHTLASADRHPVILILDELLDIFPIEMTVALKKQPVTRIPSIHFAQALYREHSHTIFRSGVDAEEGYYIVNPSGDLKDCENAFREILPLAAPTWDGLFGVPPTESQFIHALSKSSIFVYCGHGGGNQYADTIGVERTRTKAVTFLIGCSSNRIISQGGRVEGHSIFNSYIIGGCPCTVGMLWDVTDVDANQMTEYLLTNWLKPLKSSKPNSVDNICKMVQALSVQENVNEEVVSSIQRGLCVLVGIHRDDTDEDKEYLAQKLLKIRLWDDDKGRRWANSVTDMDMDVLCVSQFTIYYTMKGNKPDFRNAMASAQSEPFYNSFLDRLRQLYKTERIKDGRFGAMMQVHIQNDGPVTVELESPYFLKRPKEGRENQEDGSSGL